MFPLIDRGAFGASFDGSQYVVELSYKPILTGAAPDTASQLNLTLETGDGYIAGARAGEQWQWGFTDLLNKYASGTKDANGFVTVQNNGGSMSQANAFFHGQSYMYSSGNPTGDNVADFNTFEGDPIKVPNGAPQITIQTVFGAMMRSTRPCARLLWIIGKSRRWLSARSIRVRPKWLAWIRVAV